MGLKKCIPLVMMSMMVDSSVGMDTVRWVNKRPVTRELFFEEAEELFARRQDADVVAHEKAIR
jgi:hypothetical protein